MRKVFRKYIENSGKPSEKAKWKCKHYIYKTEFIATVVITDEQIKEVFILAVNKVIRTPSLLQKKQREIPKCYSPEFRKLDQKIKDMEADEQFSSKELATMIFQRAALLYQTAQVHDYEHHTKNIMQALSGREQQTEFNEELFLQTVKKLVIYKDGRVEIEFINGLIVHETYRKGINMQAVKKKNVSIIPSQPAYDRSIKVQLKALRVAAYCRVSTLLEQQESSYDADILLYRENQQNPNWKLAGIYADDGSLTNMKKR